MIRKTSACLAVMMAGMTPASAQQANEDWQAIDAMTATVAHAMGRTAVPIDRRILLARCPEQASITAVDAQTLAVRCPSLGWRVRVAMTAADGTGPSAATYARPSTLVIRRGDNVRVTIDSQNFSISYSSIATQEGRVGETIALRGSDAKTMLSAVVTGPGRASLDN